jgi:hypothetical protein
MPSQTQTKPGARVRVWKADMSEDLGHGTFIEYGIVVVEGMGNIPTLSILLDSGNAVLGFQIHYVEVLIEPAAAMEVTVFKTVRLFRNVGRLQLIQCEQHLAQETSITIKALRPMIYDRRLQLAARITQDGETFYFLVCESGLQLHYTEA